MEKLFDTMIKEIVDLHCCKGCSEGSGQDCPNDGWGDNTETTTKRIIELLKRYEKGGEL